MNRRRFLIHSASALALAFLCSFPILQASAAAPGRAELERAVLVLLSKQHEDGAWRSANYAQLKTGQTLTPFILDALLQAKAAGAEIPKKNLTAAREFILRHLDPQKYFLGFDDPTWPEYPTYATAYALRALTRINDPRDAEIIRRMTQALSASQFNEENGFLKDHAAYGGWGFSPVRPRETTGHMDLAHTRRVLEALRSAQALGAPVDRAVFQRAEKFLALVQRDPRDTRIGNAVGDGGFYLSPVVIPANKGGLEPATTKHDAYYRSYATATCDGVLALLATGASTDDPRVQKALQWLTEHPDLTYPQGVPTDHPDGMGHAIHYYHFAVRAESLARTAPSGNWRQPLIKLLQARQLPDGSYLNSRNPLMKEDDPLLCTTLALVALSQSIQP